MARITQLVAFSFVVLAVAWLYAVSRGQSGTFGFSFATLVHSCDWMCWFAARTRFGIGIALLFGASAGLWALGSGVPLRRWNRGDCAACGYPRSAGGARCSECGKILVPPSPRFSRRFVIAALLIPIAGLLSGIALGEICVSIDELRFRSEVHSMCLVAGGQQHHRPRAWPNENCSLRYDTGRGYWLND